MIKHWQSNSPSTLCYLYSPNAYIPQNYKNHYAKNTIKEWPTKNLWGHLAQPLYFTAEESSPGGGWVIDWNHTTCQLWCSSSLSAIKEFQHINEGSGYKFGEMDLGIRSSYYTSWLTKTGFSRKQSKLPVGSPQSRDWLLSEAFRPSWSSEK